MMNKWMVVKWVEKCNKIWVAAEMGREERTKKEKWDADQEREKCERKYSHDFLFVSNVSRDKHVGCLFPSIYKWWMVPRNPLPLSRHSSYSKPSLVNFVIIYSTSISHNFSFPPFVTFKSWVRSFTILKKLIFKIFSF